MADVQIDNGEFTRIANILLEQTARIHLNGTQYSIILTVWRFTYGFQRCEHKLSVTFVANATDISVRAIKKELKVLIDRNIILVSKESTKAESRVLKFNKDYESWKVGEKMDKKEQGNNSSPGEQKDPSQGNNQSPEQGNKKTPKKEIKKTKDIYIVFKFWNDTKIIVHRSMSKKIEGHINAKLENYSVEEICNAIENYSLVLNGEQYFWTHKWTLAEFLLRGLEKFTDESDPLQNFLGHSRGKVNKPEKSNEEKSREILARLKAKT